MSWLAIIKKILIYVRKLPDISDRLLMHNMEQSISQTIRDRIKNTQFDILYSTLDQIAQKIAERDREQIMPTGDTALNILGFSTQVPMNAVFITNGANG